MSEIIAEHGRFGVGMWRSFVTKSCYDGVIGMNILLVEVQERTKVEESETANLGDYFKEFI